MKIEINDGEFQNNQHEIAALLTHPKKETILILSKNLLRSETYMEWNEESKSVMFRNKLVGMFIMMISLLSCSTSQNPSTNQQKMKELKLNSAEIQEIVSPTLMGETYYQFTFKYERKFRDAVFYYQQHSGMIEEMGMNEKCTVTLTKKHHELPRSVYPLLTQGYIVVKFSWLGMETYQVIKEFKRLEPKARN